MQKGSLLSGLLNNEICRSIFLLYDDPPKIAGCHTNNWRFETMEYFLQLIMIHLLIIALLFMPFFICVTMLIKSKKKIYILFSLISFIFLLVLYNRDVFLGYKITNECYVKKHFFRKTYYLSNNRG